MQVFNLTQYAAIKAEKYINAHCGGRYKRKEAYNIGGIGVGGLRYAGGIEAIEKIDTQERFRANLETFKDGLGIYVRSLSYNFLLTIPSTEITEIGLSKEEDELKHAGFSFTKKLLGWGMPYHYASIMLLEQEIVELHPTMLSIHTLDHSFDFTIKRYNPYKVEKYFAEGPQAEKFNSVIRGYKFS